MAVVEERLRPRMSQCRNFCLWFRREWLLVATLISVVIGITLAVSFRKLEVSNEVLLLVELPGYVFISLLKLVVLPIMISSVITGSSNLTGKSEGRLAMTTAGFFLMTSFVSSVIGLVLVVIIHPGSPKIKELFDGVDEEFNTRTRLFDTFLDLFRNAFPENLLQACIHQEYTEYQEVINATGGITLKRVISKRNGVNSLGLIIFCMVFGVSMGGMKEQARVMKNFFVSLDKIVMSYVLIILKIMPIGVISLICAKFLGAGDVVLLVQQMALFLVTVLVGLAIQLFVFQPFVYWIVTKKNPYFYMWNCLEAAITAFGVSSSSAAMPVTLRCVEEKCKVDRRVSRFVIPIGVTVNMNGTALFITAATFFIAQMNNTLIGAGEVIAVLITATAVSIASASVPSASIFLMVMTLSVVGAPVGDVTLLFATEWILDRSRTVNNVLGDAFACGVVSHLCKEQLQSEPIQTGIELGQFQIKRKVPLAEGK